MQKEIKKISAFLECVFWLVEEVKMQMCNNNNEKYSSEGGGQNDCDQQ